MSSLSRHYFSKDIQPYLTEIAARLWSGHAAVMVGAGFSKNAINNDPTKPGFPNWFELGNLFYKKIHGTTPGNDQHYLNLLKLAEEVQAAFGRSVLDQLIKEYVPDSDHQPSDLHIKLLGLPWADIFTTNYDTLLERAGEHVFSQKYDLVINKEDLIYAKRPRIIKLHGSFPSERPLIVTEEDYRSYPRLFAPFVNTVQQSLIENTLCLIGFSGDDPNFIQWIGWIMDNLGKENSPKIYLVGMTNMSHAQRKLLESKNVVIVNLSPTEGTTSHYSGLMNFVDYLYQEKKKDLHIDWPGKRQFFLKEDDKVSKLISRWKKQRLEYPNWVILPHTQRDQLWYETSGNYLREDDFAKLEAPQDIEYLYEFNWRLELALSTMFDEQISSVESILNKYVQLFTAPNEITGSLATHPLEEVKNWWLRLALGLLRFYRHEAFHDKWIILNNRLKLLISEMSADLQARYHYEICLNTIFSLKFSQLQTDLDNWPVNEALPFWEAKRAALLAESGNITEATKILERSLTRIRQRLNLNPVVNDYTWVSQESYVMQLLEYVTRAAFRHQDDENTSHFKERWNYLKSYKCDPWLEIDVFGLKLDRIPADESEISISFGFDLGEKTTHRKFGIPSNEANTAYNYLRYIEEAGIPFRFPEMTWADGALSGAIERIKSHSAYWAITALIRSGVIKSTVKILDRAFVEQLSVQDVSNLLNYFIEMTAAVLTEFENGGQVKNSGLEPNLPYLLSVLLVKATSADKFKVADLFIQIYQSPEMDNFSGIKELTKRLLKSMTEAEKAILVPTLLELPLKKAKREMDDLPDPISLIHFRSIPGIQKSSIKPDIIIELLKKAQKDSPDRDKAIARLCQLLRFQVLNQQQIKRFTRMLYAQVDQLGFPSGTKYRLFSFVNLPSPDNVDTISVFKNYILREDLPIKATSNEKGTAMTRGRITVLSELLDGTRTKFSKYGVIWSVQEGELLFKKLLHWWQADNKYLNLKESRSMFGSIPEEFRQRFNHIPKLLSQVISINPFWQENQQISLQIKQLIQELEANDFPCINVKFAFLNLFEEEQDGLFDKIYDELVRGEKESVLDAVNTMIDMTINPIITQNYKPQYLAILDLVIQQIKWRNFIWFEYAVSALQVVLNHAPEVLTISQIRELEIGLLHLLNETGPENQELETDPRLVFRKKAMRLAREMYKIYTPDSAPEVYKKWKSISESDKEFWEIRNQWY